MRLNREFDRLAAGVLGFFAAFGGIGCIVTGIGFPGVSMGAVAVTCAMAAAAAALTADRKWFGLFPGGLLVLGWLLWKNGGLNASVEALLSRITTMYDAGYGWGVIRWSPSALEPAFAQMAFRFLGAFLALGICRSFLQGKGIWFSALLTCLPVIPCMLLTDTVPSAKYLFLSMVCLVLLLLVRLAKKRGQGAALLKLLTLPVVIAVFLLFLWMPQEGSNNIAFADSIISYVQELFDGDLQIQQEAPVRQESNWVNLSTIGPKNHRKGKVMEVTAEKTGYLYLRGTVYDAYWGTWWDNRNDAVEQPKNFRTDSLSVTVTTTALHDVLYLPYRSYGINGSSLLLAEVNGVVENPAFWRSYTVQYQQLPGYEASWETPAIGISNQYLQLPGTTKAAALAYLQREVPELEVLTGVWSRATAIVRHVSSSATYNLRTPRMPEGTQDFAMWFLEESDTGYCTHFATAATVLLRAAGIPCRYVTGYLVDAKADTAVAVVHDNAHAWVECYLDGAGWVPLEPTPSGGISQTVGSTPTEPSETVTPSAPTGTTAPSESTEPRETTQPEESTAPTLPPAATQPQGTGPIGGADSPQTQPGVFPNWLKWVLGCLGFAALVLAQWRLRLQLRRHLRSRGNRSAQALARWREITLHVRLRKCDPDQRMLELAQRARFSHHAITREELKEMDAWLASSTEAIRTMGLWQKILATLILALYG